MLDRVSNYMIAIFRDVTQEERRGKPRRVQPGRRRRPPIKVVDKQMRIVQEIASLLGETAAEYQIRAHQAQGVDVR